MTGLSTYAGAMDAAEWDARYETADYVWTVTVNQFVEAHLGELAPGTAIDLGAGEGRNAVWLAQRGWQVTAVDFSAAGLAKGRALADHHGVDVEWVVGDARTWQAPEPVDLVVLSYLQVPSAEQHRILGAAATWLRPGGMVFVIAHDKTNIEHGYGGPQDPDVCYSPDDTVAALDGLDIRIAEVAERVKTTDDGDHVALDTLVAAVRPA